MCTVISFNFVGELVQFYHLDFLLVTIYSISTSWNDKEQVLAVEYNHGPIYARFSNIVYFRQLKVKFI